jgi:O-antigen ligase
VFLFFSIISTGSLGAVVAFLGGAFVYAVGYLFIHRTIKAQFELLHGAILIFMIFGGLAYVSIDRSPDLIARLERTSYMRIGSSFEKRFILFEEGGNIVLDQSVIWGIGPGAFSEEVFGIQKVGGAHNDLMAFLIERGILGAMGLIVLGLMLINQSARSLIPLKADTVRAEKILVFLAALVCMFVESQVHQIFHFRVIWLVFALQEAVILRTKHEK